jgi:hypothetical protein
LERYPVNALFGQLHGVKPDAADLVALALDGGCSWQLGPKSGKSQLRLRLFRALGSSYKIDRGR